MTIQRIIFLSGLMLSFAAATFAEDKKPPLVTFDDHVRPIFQQKCAACHNPDKKSADLDLTNYSSLMQGGASGEVIDAGDAAASYLYRLVTHEEEPAMPPDSPKIADEMIETLRKWIDGGVLENSGSTAKASKKKKFDLSLAAPSTERPDVTPLPARLSLQPDLYAAARTAVDALATSPWAPLAAVSGQKQVLLYHTQTLDLLGVLPFPEGTPRVLKFSRNGALLLCGGGVAGASGRVVVWDIRSGERIIELGDELDEVLAADISSDQSLIALGGPQRVVRIYATETGQLLHEIRKHTDWVTAMEFSPDSVLLATGDRNGGLQVWEGWTGREYLTLKGHTAGITDVSWRSDSNIVASSSEDSTIRLWEMENGGEVKNWGAHGGGALSVEFTRDGRLFSSGRDRTPKIWDQNGAQQIALEAFPDLALRVTYCDETNRAIGGDWNGEIRVYQSTDGARLGQLEMNVPPLEQRLTEANQLLAMRQSEHHPIAESFAAAENAMQKAGNDLANAQKRSADAKPVAEAAQAALIAAQAAMTKAAQASEAANSLVDGLTKTVPVLQEAADKAAAAAAQLPEDGELKNAVEMIRKTALAKTTERDTAMADAAVKLAEMQQAQAALVQSQTLSEQASTALNQATQEEQSAAAALKPIEESYTAVKQSFDQSNAALDSAKQLVARWTSEIEFHQQFTDLKKQRSEARDQLAGQETQWAALQETAQADAANVTQAKQVLTDSTVSLAKNESDMKTATDAIATAKASAMDAAKAKIAAMERADRINQVVAHLNDAVAKSDAALALVADDATLIAATNSLKSALAEKSMQLETATNDLAAKTQAEQVAIAAVSAAEKIAADLIAQRPQLEQQLTAATAAVKPLQATSEQSQLAAQAYEQTVMQSQSKLDAISQAIATLQGLTAAASP